MAEGVDTLTFPMSRDSESGSRLKAIISDIVPRFSENDSDDVFSEYITVLICNGKSQRQTREDLEAFLGEQSCEFVACLWELLAKHFSHGKPASEPRTAVDFGSHNTLIKRGLSSRNHDYYDHKATDDTNSVNEKLISATAPIEDVETPVSPKVENMKMLRQELINSPCRRLQRKEKSDFDYTKRILRSVIVSAIKQPCGMNPDKYEKSMDERSGVVKKRPYLPGREMGSQSVPSGAVSSRSYGASAHQDTTSRVSVWDRLGRPSSKHVCDRETPALPKFGIQAHENKVLQQHGPAFPATYSEQYNMTFQREVPGVDCWRRVFQPKSETITSTGPHAACNLSRKRRYGIFNPNSKEFSSVIQYKQAKQDVEKPTQLSYQSTKSDLFSQIKNVKEKLQELELRIIRSKQLKKQKVEELKCLPQSGELQYNQDVAKSSIIHVTNVHYAAKKEAISMFFSKCGAVKNVTIVTDPVTQHPKGSAFVTFATKESVNKAIALSGTIFYSRPIKICGGTL